MILRDYQGAAIDDLYRFFGERRGSGALGIAPTGSGKSVIIAGFAKRACDDYPATRILCVTHVRELIAQNFGAMLRAWPQAPAGIYSAGLGKRQARAQVLFAGVQSIAKRVREIGHVDLVIVDEAHLIPRAADTLYGKLFTGLLAINPNLKFIGLTATPYRLDSGALIGGDGAMFDGVAFEIPMSMLIERGYLAPLVSKRPDTVIDLSGVRTRAGEYVTAQAEAAANAVTETACDEIVALGDNRRAWLAFCVSVDHAEAVADALRRRGVPCATVTGQTPAAERDRLVRDYKEGRLRALSSVGVLTTGFDAPQTDLIAMLRPTQSTGLYVQICGRGMRPADGKEDCLVLDFAGNVVRHGPVDAIPMPGTKGEATKQEGEIREAPGKVCPNCQSIAFIGARECRDCGYEWPAPEPKHEATAGTEAVMVFTAPDVWEPVKDVAYSRHVKAGSPDSLRVDYLVGEDRPRVVSEWVCFEHTGFAREKAVAWWRQWAPGVTVPDTVAGAIEAAEAGDVLAPAEAVVIRDGKYHRIKRVRMAAPVIQKEALRHAV